MGNHEQQTRGGKGGLIVSEGEEFGCADGEPVGGNGSGSEKKEEGRETMEDLLQDRPQLVSLLDHQAVVEKQSGEWLYQEGEEIARFAYIVMGRVKIITAGEVTGEVKAQELLGLDEFLLRDENPKYAKAAQAVEPTFLLWLDEHGLRVVADLDKGAIKAYMRLTARIHSQLEATVRRLRSDKDALEGRVARLGVALGQTQDELAVRLPANFPSRPNRVSSPPSPRKVVPQPDLLTKMASLRRTNRNLAQLFNARAKNLEELLQALRAVVTAHSDWAKQKDFAAFVKLVEGLVARDSKIEVVIPPD